MSRPNDRGQQDDGAEVAFTILSGYFPEPEDKERVRRRLADALAEEFKRAGMEPPPWLDEVAE